MHPITNKFAIKVGRGAKWKAFQLWSLMILFTLKSGGSQDVALLTGLNLLTKPSAADPGICQRQALCLCQRCVCFTQLVVQLQSQTSFLPACSQFLVIPLFLGGGEPWNWVASCQQVHVCGRHLRNRVWVLLVQIRGSNTWPNYCYKFTSPFSFCFNICFLLTSTLLKKVKGALISVKPRHIGLMRSKLTSVKLKWRAPKHSFPLAFKSYTPCAWCLFCHVGLSGN